MISLRTAYDHPDNQGRAGSCVAHALTTAMEIFLARAGKPVQLSRRYLYAAARMKDNFTSIPGTFTSSGIWAATEKGVPEERLFPYVEDDPGVINLPSFPAENTFHATATKIENTEIAEWLAKGYPVYFTTNPTDAMLALKGPLNQQPHWTPVPGIGHAVCFVGQMENGWYIARNWAGHEYGDEGDFVFPDHRGAVDCYAIGVLGYAPVPAGYDNVRLKVIRDYLTPILKQWRADAVAYNCPAYEVDNAMGWAPGTFDRIAA